MYESATIRRRGRISRQGPAVHRDALIGIAWGEVDPLDAVRAAIHVRIPEHGVKRAHIRWAAAETILESPPISVPSVVPAAGRAFKLVLASAELG
jgi:hypothetical protein